VYKIKCFLFTMSYNISYKLRDTYKLKSGYDTDDCTVKCCTVRPSAGTSDFRLQDFVNINGKFNLTVVKTLKPD
jgi:hypothetical protein